MTKQAFKHLMDVAAGRTKADLVLKNCHVIDVYSSNIIEGDLALCDGLIAGVGNYEGENEIDCEGAYAAPGLIDSHIHIESSYVTPEEMGRLVVPHGTTTIVADPHEIANVCGLGGLRYMLKAAEHTPLDILYMMPSCVPATPFENSGAVLGLEEVREMLQDERILGLGEFMNFPGVVAGDAVCVDKILAAQEMAKPVDGHSVSLSGKELNAYAAARILTDHECSTVEEMQDRIARGMYVLLREGSACHDLPVLVKGVTAQNSRRCLLCSDDRQPKTLLNEGHLNCHLQMCVQAGIDPIVAIQMASLNAAECYGLADRGALAPGLRADVVLFEDLHEFRVKKVFITGQLQACNGQFLQEVTRCDSLSVQGHFCVKDFSIERLNPTLSSNCVHCMQLVEGGVVTKKTVEEIKLDETGNFVFDSDKDIAKMAVVERHHGTGNVALGFLKGYGIRKGAVALSIAHDSHNIITVGTNDADMAFAVQTLIDQGGGIVLALNGEVLCSMPMPIAGIMSDQSGEWVSERLEEIHDVAYKELGITGGVEPVMTLCFMSLAVIPEIKLTDRGLFDVLKFDFIPLEAHD